MGYSVSLVDGHIDEPRITDEDVIKALEICNSLSRRCGDGCPYYTVPYKNGKRCSEMMIDDTLNLINRQKTVIERLHEVINGFEEQSHKELMDFMNLSEKYTNAKAEIERLKKANKDLSKEIYTSTRR